MAFRARFIPRNPHKYKGDVEKIFARSSWEVSVMKFFDQSRAVLEWKSEETVIPYISPEDNRIHEYWPDFLVTYVDEHGTTHQEIVEVKPRHEADEKYAKSERSKAALEVNEAKWKAARSFCEKYGLIFQIVTEDELFKK